MASMDDGSYCESCKTFGHNLFTVNGHNVCEDCYKTISMMVGNPLNWEQLDSCTAKQTGTFNLKASPTKIFKEAIVLALHEDEQFRKDVLRELQLLKEGVC